MQDAVVVHDLRLERPWQSPTMVCITYRTHIPRQNNNAHSSHDMVLTKIDELGIVLPQPSLLGERRYVCMPDPAHAQLDLV